MIKTHEGAKLLTIDDLEASQFFVDHMLDAFDMDYKYSDSLQLQITHSHITIATIHNGLFNTNFKLMTIPIAEM
jgi:hypothetical protein